MAMERARLPMLLLLLTIGLPPGLRAQDYAQEMGPLVVDGRLTDGENKLVGAEVVVFVGNEQISSVKTDKAGRFHEELELNKVYGIEFRQVGFVPKRIAIDTHMPKPKPDQEFELAPIDMNVSMLERDRYDGANTDDLDFPFALIKFNKHNMVFEQDLEYTMGMQRVNGALLLMAARSEKR